MNELNRTISGVLGDFIFLSPEMVLVAGAIILCMVQLIQSPERYGLKVGLTIATLFLSGWMISCCSIDAFWMNGVFWQSEVTRSLKYFLLVITGSVLLFSNTRDLLKRGEYQFLILMVLVGSFMVMQSTNLLVFYISIELISISSYVLISFNFNNRSFEAGIKYLLFGAMSSGLMLYGISLFYGFSGSLNFVDFQSFFVANSDGNIWMIVALVLFLMGLLFKLAMVPMHVWAPDAYEAGPTSIVAYISVLPKVAVLVFFYQFVEISGMGDFGFDWRKLLSALALVSMFFGNLSALKQNNLKRMLAYSSIAHSGFLILGIISGSAFGMQSMFFYLIVYGVMNIGAFYIAGLMEKNQIVAISDMAGLGRKYPALAVFLVIIMVSLVGLPPTAGFTSKLLIFSALYESYESMEQSYIVWLFVLGILNAAISLFYYLKVPYFMIIKAKTDTKITISMAESAYLLVVSILLLWLFFQADLLLNILNPTKFAF